MKALVKIGRDSITIDNAYASDYENEHSKYKHHLIVQGNNGYFIVEGNLDDKTGVFTVADKDLPAWYVDDSVDIDYGQLVDQLSLKNLPSGVVKCEFSFK